MTTSTERLAAAAGVIGLEIDGVAHLLHVSRRTAYHWLQRGSEPLLAALRGWRR